MTGTDSGDVGDDQEVAGLAGERTDLAWSRSGLAILACLAAIAKRILPDLASLDGRAILVAGLMIGGIAWMFSMLWSRSIASTTLAGRRVADPRTLRMVSLGTALLGVIAIGIAFLPGHTH
jgi:uncharacterized membrane protein YidH (DUF202 family)